VSCVAGFLKKNWSVQFIEDPHDVSFFDAFLIEYQNWKIVASCCEGGGADWVNFNIDGALRRLRDELLNSLS